MAPFRTLCCLSLGLPFVFGDEVAYGDWDYSMQGLNWIERGDSCGTHERQSPINIKINEVPDLTRVQDFSVVYQLPEKLKILDDAKTIRVTSADDAPFGQLKSNQLSSNHTFTLKYIEFHAPTEHTFTEDKLRRRALEMQLVHLRDGDSEDDRFYAIVSITFDLSDMGVAGAGDPFLDVLLEKGLPSQNNAFKTVSVALRDAPLLQKSVKQMREEDNVFFFYRGSFTTPPCTGNAIWFVKEKALTLSKPQLDRFTSSLTQSGTEGNYRVVQNALGRMANHQQIARILLTPELSDMAEEAGWLDSESGRAAMQSALAALTFSSLAAEAEVEVPFLYRRRALHSSGGEEAEESLHGNGD
uniref:carbonic anhydrase n=1 Tax=Chromera velia CCMP2878 TaxID=1169474 RepID=A0A0G4I2Y1_9ALVE|mmetsp:Transcript_4834/g.9689  ORF Transcript_4834/g.9689 Transcript_4834/m.9689 type:complete len:357 (+) Transcript_4834:224-1294(+)|eukprot:Cvel_10523.t1-p1 / transcript=Cvel_10523.t1 / gene=Cvel_10523 / organism=Chromera_velia_CCMP2878 / gene_product=Carbonic anhydrase 6, putative / transcript_product=Carbonic anhydrase 6, putative / location=Cvel_scaffold636:68008-72352(-) / protein_length=356 / sequence_SO=supercontig / SO=protein_coding / is_pseudo=false